LSCILKGTQQTVQTSDDAPKAGWHPGGMHVVLCWIPAVSLRSTAGLSKSSHASGMTRGCMLEPDSANPFPASSDEPSEYLIDSEYFPEPSPVFHVHV
jgi:hypothetical protein